MIPYVALLVYVISLFFAEEFVPDFKCKKMVFAIGAFFPLILLSSLKDPSVGSDTNTYYLAYSYLKNQQIGSVYKELDLAFCVLLSVFAKIGFSFNATLFILYTFIYSPFILLSYKFANRNSLFVTFVLLFQMFVFLMSGLRQAIAISFCLFALFSFLCIRKKIIAIIVFVFLVFLGSRFHGSALVFLIVAPFLYFKNRIIINPFLALPLFVLLAFLSPYLYSFLFFLIESQFFYDPPKTTMFFDVGFSTYIIISGCILFYLSNNKALLWRSNALISSITRSDNKRYFVANSSLYSISFFNISLVNCAILCAVSCSQVFIRVGYYFNPIFSLLVSGSFSMIQDRKLRLAIFPIVVSLLLIFFYFSVYRGNYLSIFPYKFCF